MLHASPPKTGFQQSVSWKVQLHLGETSALIPTMTRLKIMQSVTQYVNFIQAFFTFGMSYGVKIHAYVQFYLRR
jgi:hypothetical protein